jgi:hypothetical protein
MAAFPKAQASLEPIPQKARPRLGDTDSTSGSPERVATHVRPREPCARVVDAHHNDGSYADSVTAGTDA